MKEVRGEFSKIAAESQACWHPEVIVAGPIGTFSLIRGYPKSGFRV